MLAFRAFRLTLGLMAAAFIASCGDGGGGSSGSATPPPVVVTPPAAGNLLLTMPPSTYLASSQEAKVFAELNDARIKGGFGALRQSVNLDLAAKAHATYFFKKWYTVPYGAFIDGTATPLLDSNGNRVTYYNASTGYGETDASLGWLKGHLEYAGDVGFKGVYPWDRAAAAGYGYSAANTVSEVIGFQNRSIQAGCVDGLLATVYHRADALKPGYSDVGIGVDDVSQPLGVNFPCVVNAAVGAAAPVVPDGWKGVYPGDKQTNVQTFFTEVPDPWPAFKNKGIAVSYFITEGHSLTVTSFTLKGPDGVALETALITKASDLNGYIASDNQAHLVPNGFLKANTTYTASFSGIDKNGATQTATALTWTFTTRP